MKRIISLIIVAVTALSLLTSCGTDNTAKKDDGLHTLYFKDSTKSSKVTAAFFNSSDKKTKIVKMKKIGEDKKSYTFSCRGDCSAYNMAYIVYDGKKTSEFAFNKCVSGWYKTEDNFLPYVQGKKNSYKPDYDIVTLNYKGYEQLAYIWTPDGFDASSNEKYSAVYVLDARIMTYIESPDNTELGNCPLVTEQVRSMTAETGKKTIVVALDTSFARDNVLVPKIGISADEKMFGKADYDSINGSELSDYIAKELVPYVQKHYNVSSDPLENSITGASLGGLESFYIIMEHPEIFGTLGSFSPSFWAFDSITWNKYLKNKSFDENSPLLYFYSGGKKIDTDPHVTNMYKRLNKMGYPKDKLVLHKNEKGVHAASYWKSVFSEFLSAMVLRRVEPLQ